MIFWDLPDLKTIAENEEKLRSSFENMDALYIVSLKNTKNCCSRSRFFSIFLFYRIFSLGQGE